MVDFSAEELLLAQELQHLFTLEQEEFPPYAIQALRKEPYTLMVSDALVQQVTTEVFRRLHLVSILRKRPGNQPSYSLWEPLPRATQEVRKTQR